MNLHKNFPEIMSLQECVKAQYINHAGLVQLLFDEGKSDRRSSGREIYPQIEQGIIDKFNNMQKSYPTKKNISAGGQIKMVNITQIFDEDTQHTIKAIERFFKAIVRNKMYWTRDILQFFGIADEDITVFLSFHQIYIFSLNQRYQHRSFSGVNLNQVAGRAGSYWNAGGPKKLTRNEDGDATAKFETLEDQESEGFADKRGNNSFHVNMNRDDFTIKSQYMYGESHTQSLASSVDVSSNLFPHAESIANLDDIMRG